MANQKVGLRTRITEHVVNGRTNKNDISAGQEKGMARAVKRVQEDILANPDFKGLQLHFQSQISLNYIISQLSQHYQHTNFTTCFKRSSIRPDGGITFIKAKDGKLYPILIGEKKNQGTNDLRRHEGLKRQSKGNAIERLGKNVIGLKTYTMQWNIFPFACFGDGCDFANDSSIIDRVKTIAMFGELNEEYLNVTDNLFLRGTYYFRQEEWTEDEMYEKMLPLAQKSIYHFFGLFGKDNFI